MIFETARLVVRQFTAADADDFFRLNGNPQVMQFIRPAKTREACDLFLQENLRYYERFPLYGRWAAYEKATGNFIGSFALIPVEYKDDMQLGYALLPEAWGKGYATELTAAGLDYIFTKTAITTIYGITEKENVPSQQVLLKTGFKRTSPLFENGRELLRFVKEKEG